MSKVAIVGAGAVGTAIAYAAQIRGVCRQLALFDLNAQKGPRFDMDHRFGAGCRTRQEGRHGLLHGQHIVQGLQ